MRTIITKLLWTFSTNFMRFVFQCRGTATDCRWSRRRLQWLLLWHSFYRRPTIAFCVRALIAMCKQSKGQKICHLVRLRSYQGESATQMDRTIEIPSFRTALSTRSGLLAISTRYSFPSFLNTSETTELSLDFSTGVLVDWVKLSGLRLVQTGSFYS
jgi:hypothetical protein